MTCTSCSRTVPEGSRFCPHCGAPASAASFDPTRTSGSRGAPASDPTTSSDHGRFIPGTVLGARYRIIGLLGRGGMGEVYRADDLKLGQAVALKFLPEIVENDAARLQRFLNEVKIARQISHPNVCRVYDVGEVDGHHYLSMEYVDGEDLASLLRRIGRLPKDKAVQISRQLCMGLAAAHEQGILHRDLKPANVMIDGRGRARITDFGLATLAGAVRPDEVGAGTPLYMSPEQRDGKDLTVRSDLYSLGLVLYELFTGERAFGAATADAPTNPSHHVEGFDPAVERIILRCIAKEPSGRPASALAVAAALPGGDPLAAAVAAGETPSPELVAAAGEAGSLRPGIAVACVAGVVAGVVLAIALSSRTQLTRVVPLPKPPEVLVERAREVIRTLGISAAKADSVYGFDFVKDYGDYLREHTPVAAFWQRLGEGSPSVIDFWYRQSPGDLVGYAQGDLSYKDPPFLVPGMAGVRLEPDGRLKQLDGVPADRDASKGPWPEPQWALLFREAGLDLANFKSVEPSWTPPVSTDSRAAWESAGAAAPDAGTRIEAAAYHGIPVFFRVIGPWTQPVGSDPAPASLVSRIVRYLSAVMLFVVLIGGTLIARRNLRLGRTDRRGAAFVTVFVLTAGFLDWVLTTHHIASGDEINLFLHGLAVRVFIACVCWLFYLAIEPYVRRLWPQVLVSWVRLLDGRFGDPLVGRDVLFGILGGLGFQLLFLGWPLASRWFGIAPPALDELGPTYLELQKLTGLRFAFSNLADLPVAMFIFSAGFIVSLVLLRIVLRKQWLAIVAFVIVWTSLPSSANPYAAFVFSAVLNVAFLFIFLRFGFLSALVSLGVQGLLQLYQTTFDFTRWYAPNTIFVLIVLSALTVYGFRVAVAGRSILGDAGLER
jgi:serine/threonine-protein kinase